MAAHLRLGAISVEGTPAQSDSGDTTDLVARSRAKHVCDPFSQNRDCPEHEQKNIGEEQS